MTATHPVIDPTTITVYGAGWCADCRRSKRLLDSRAATYAWVDTGTPGVRDELRAAGYEAIPVIVFPDGSILMEPSDAALVAALDRLAAGSGDGPAS
jgi:mycoredoxin